MQMRVCFVCLKGRSRESGFEDNFDYKVWGLSATCLNKPILTITEGFYKHLLTGCAIPEKKNFQAFSTISVFSLQIIFIRDSLKYYLSQHLSLCGIRDKIMDIFSLVIVKLNKPFKPAPARLLENFKMEKWYWKPNMWIYIWIKMRLKVQIKVQNVYDVVWRLYWVFL